MGNPNCAAARVFSRCLLNSKGLVGSLMASRAFVSGGHGCKPSLVVLGSGWASYNLLRHIDPSIYNITVVSPRPYFVFTPLLTSAVGGTLSTRNLLTPLKHKVCWPDSIKYIQAKATGVDPSTNTVTCEMTDKCEKEDGDKETGKTVKVTYDKLVVGVGSETNTFNIPGAKENSQFLKDLHDVAAIRRKLFYLFRRAASPGVADRKRLLSVVVIGGGPAGVEVAAEIRDLMNRELRKQFPAIIEDATVTIVEMLPGLLPMFGKQISRYAMDVFGRIGIRTLTEHKVERVEKQFVLAKDKEGKEVRIPYGQLIWASGIGQTAFVNKLIQSIPKQAGNRWLRVHPNLRVIGAQNLYAFGDCAMLTPPPLVAKADELYRASQGNTNWLAKNREKLVASHFVQLQNWNPAPDAAKVLTKSEWDALLRTIDSTYRPPAPTAQTAKQAGGFLGMVLNSPSRLGQTPFLPKNKGAMSYVGDRNAVIEILLSMGRRTLTFRKLGGVGSHCLWQGYYWMNQTTLYNRWLTLLNVTRTHWTGRDVVDHSADIY